MDQPAETLRFDQVELRRWRVSDIETLHPVITESLDHLLPWMPWAASHGRKQTEEYLARCEEQWGSGQGYDYAITSGGAVIGSCGLMRRIGPGGLEIGYWLHPTWTRKGLATMAAAALVHAGQQLPEIDRIEIHHDEANPASGAVARRLGFTEAERVRLPDGPTAPGEAGVRVIWRLHTQIGSADEGLAVTS
ncbi:GNAT family N-acetyltransferase [Streptomyces sp. NPDC004533]|uniref:GNAT family N-acetyltransferase n=1 Tax=unclassified Streptomyces TaxID=2593676 RepID=UPI0033BC50A9